MSPNRPIPFTATDRWRAAHPGASVAMLQLSGVTNEDADPRLDALLEATATDLRVRHAGASRQTLVGIQDLAPYVAYYRRFDKTYHVLLQLESVVLKERPIRARGTLVGAMFAAELTTGLLTAGLDADAVAGGIAVDVVAPGERYATLGGREVEAVLGDMAMRDDRGIVSSIVYGPDDRTKLGPATRSAVFTVYGPAGVGRAALDTHLALLEEHVRAVDPAATVDASVVLTAD